MLFEHLGHFGVRVLVLQFFSFNARLQGDLSRRRPLARRLSRHRLFRESRSLLVLKFLLDSILSRVQGQLVVVAGRDGAELLRCQNLAIEVVVRRCRQRLFIETVELEHLLLLQILVDLAVLCGKAVADFVAVELQLRVRVPRLLLRRVDLTGLSTGRRRNKIGDVVDISSDARACLLLLGEHISDLFADVRLVNWYIFD